MNLIKELEVTEALAIMTKEELEAILVDKQLEEMIKFMSIQKIPYLHAIQVGITKNFFVWQHRGAWRIVMNPKYTSLKKSSKLQTVGEISYTYRSESGAPRVIKTQRALNIVGMFDKYVKGKTLKRGNEQLTAHEAIAFAQMADLSAGLNLSRFIEVKDDK